MIMVRKNYPYVKDRFMWIANGFPRILKEKLSVGIHTSFELPVILRSEATKDL